ncbi:MAG: amidohydrolase family protein [Propionibacteriaceae bacterium]
MSTTTRDAATPPLLVRGGFVHTGDEDNQILPDGSVLAVDGRIVAVGSEADVAAACRQLDPAAARTLQTLDARGSLVLPGFVNPHWHDMFAARVAFRGAARGVDDRCDQPGFLARGGDMPLISALFDRFAAMITALTPGEAEAVARYSTWTQVRAGTTTLGDVGSLNHPAALARAAAGLGINAAVSTWASDVVSEGGSSAPRRTRDSVDVLQELSDLYALLGDDPAARVRARPSAVYLTNVSDELLTGLAQIVEAHQATFATHLGAQRNESAFVQRCFGRTPTQRLDDVGLVSDRLMAIHCAFLDGPDARRLVEARVHVNHSPAKYGPSGESTLSETGWISGLVRRGHPVSLSTDGTLHPLGAMAENMRAAWQVHNETFADQTVLPASAALAMATRVAAAGLGWAETVGSLSPGKQADLVLVPTSGPAYLLNPRPLEAFLHTGGSGDVATVVAAGRVLIEDHRAIGVDEDELERDYLSALWSFSARQPGADLAPLEHALGRRRPAAAGTRFGARFVTQEAS